MPAETCKYGSRPNLVKPRERQFGRSQLVVSERLPPNHGILT